MKRNNENRYKLLEAYERVYPGWKKQIQFQQAQRKWNQFKDYVEDYDKLLVSSNARAAKRRSAQLQWWMKTFLTKSPKGI